MFGLTLGVRTKITLGALLTLGVVSAAAKIYYDYTEEKIAKMELQISAATKLVQDAKDRQENLQAQYDDFVKEYSLSKKAVEQLDADVEVAKKDIDLIEDRIRKSNVRKVGNEQPLVLEESVNQLSNDIFTRLNDVSSPTWKGPTSPAPDKGGSR